MRRALGSFETAATLTNRHAPFVVVVVLRLEGGPSPERLAGALSSLGRRHPLLQVRIVEEDGSFWFESDGTPPIPLRVVERAGEDGWMELAEEELNSPLDAAAGPLLRCTYLAPPAPTGSARSEIVLTFHHAAMDAVSTTTLVTDLLHRCGPAAEPARKVAGTFEEVAEEVAGTFGEVAGEVAGTSGAKSALPPAEERFPPAWRGLRGRGRLAGFVARQLADEVAYRLRTRGGRLPPIPTGARCRILPLELPAEATSALARTARRHGATVNGALAAAFLLAANRRLYGEGAAALRYMTFADLRPHVVPPVRDGSLGGYLAMLRYTARLRPGMGLWELARKVSRQVSDGGRRGDRFASLRMSEWVIRTLIRRGAARMSATAVSYSGVARLERSFGPIELRGLRAFVSNFELGPEYTALARLLDGRLQLDVVYLDGDMERPLARELADDILTSLAAAAAGAGAAETERP